MVELLEDGHLAVDAVQRVGDGAGARLVGARRRHPPVQAGLLEQLPFRQDLHGVVRVVRLVVRQFHDAVRALRAAVPLVAISFSISSINPPHSSPTHTHKSEEEKKGNQPTTNFVGRHRYASGG